MKKTPSWILTLICFIFFYSCSYNDSKHLTLPAKEYCMDSTFRQTISLKEAVPEQITESITLTGSVETNPDKVINFVSLVGGIISNTYFSFGDKVTKGQILAELQSTELSSLHNEITNLESKIKVADNNLKSVSSMFEDGIASHKNLLEAQSELEILKSERQRVLSNLNLYSGDPEKGIFKIKAPSSGIITAKNISAGTQISSEGDHLFTISDLSEVWVMVNIHASSVKNIQEGMPVEIKTLSYPGLVLNGTIAMIAQVYDYEARVLKARVILSNPENKLKPGMPVDVMAINRQNNTAVSIPEESIVFDNSTNYVIVYHSDCDLEIRKVEILSKNNGTYFLSQGISEKEKIVAGNQLLIYEQLKNLQN